MDSPSQTRLQIFPWLGPAWEAWLKALAILALTLAIAARILVFNPTRLDDGKSASTAAIDPQTLLGDEKTTLAPGIPVRRVPEYTIDQFNYISIQGAERQWNLVASKANLYSQEKLVHARDVIAYLFNPDGRPTVVKGMEAKYFMNQKDLEVFGNVRTVFPDGFELDSEYLRYHPTEKMIEIPEKYLVYGHGRASDKKGQNLTFLSQGLTYHMKQSEILLRKDVRANVTAPNPTRIESDQCVINRDRQIAHFTMYPSRPTEERFVHLTQPTLFAKGRYAEMSYGDFSRMLNYMILYEDTLVKEVGTGSLRYATAGQADFDTQRNVIILRKYPQVYQDEDTVTGDVIIMHRDTDIVEVEHSNAFSEGSN